MRATEEQHNARKREMMEKCFDCYAENGLTGTGIKALAAACGCTTGNLYSYFNSVDELIIESTAYCMEKVEDDFMEMAPTDPKDVVRFVKEVPYWTAKKHGKKYRLMYQIYTHPKYIEHGKKFFEGVNERYTEYAKRLEPKIGIPYTVITPLIFIFVRACVHYAMFEDEYYLKSQMEVLKQGVALFVDKYKANHAYTGQPPLIYGTGSGAKLRRNNNSERRKEDENREKTTHRYTFGALRRPFGALQRACHRMEQSGKAQRRCTAGGAEQRHGDPVEIQR